MISAGSCDTEDWSNDDENTALHHRNTFKKENSYLNFNNISQYYYFYYTFDKIRYEHQSCFSFHSSQNPLNL